MTDARLADGRLADKGHWWGEYDVPIGQRATWRIGPLSLWVERQTREWVVWWYRSQDAGERALEVVRFDGPEPHPEADTQRLVGSSSSDPLTLGVKLPDRPFVARPETRLTVVPGGEVTIYLSLPVTVSLSHGVPLIEILSYRPSDTWLGATPRDGQLGYFSRTRALTDLRDWSPNPGRVLSALHLHNHTASAVEVPRVSLPAQQLGIYADAEHRLYTEDLSVDFRAGAAGVVAAVHLASLRPGLTRVGAPRILPDRHRLSRVWGIFE